MVSKASEDLPAPEGPGTTVTARCGTRQSIPFRLWVRARSIRMAGCLGLGIGSRRRSGSEGAAHHNARGLRAFPDRRRRFEADRGPFDPWVHAAGLQVRAEAARVGDADSGSLSPAPG